MVEIVLRLQWQVCFSPLTNKEWSSPQCWQGVVLLSLQQKVHLNFALIVLARLAHREEKIKKMFEVFIYSSHGCDINSLIKNMKCESCGEFYAIKGNYVAKRCGCDDEERFFSLQDWYYRTFKREDDGWMSYKSLNSESMDCSMT